MVLVGSCFRDLKTLSGFLVPTVYATVSMRYKRILRYIVNMKYHERPDYGHLEKLLLDIRIEKSLDFTLPCK